MTILIIGGGNMGATYARAFLRAHAASRATLHILEKSQEKAHALSQENIGTVHAEPDTCLPQADLVILAVKPQDVADLLPKLAPHTRNGQLYLSIMAGVQMHSLSLALGTGKIVRAMPNLPAQIGMGMTGFTAMQDVSRQEISTIQNLLATTGKTLFMEDEGRLDAITAISGSGPAYVFYVMRSLMEAAAGMGFTEAEAELLVAQTMRGAIDLFGQNELSCSEWIARVASRGGTTEAALKVFDAAGLNGVLAGGAHAAMLRSRELGS